MSERGDSQQRRKRKSGPTPNTRETEREQEMQKQQNLEGTAYRCHKKPVHIALSKRDTRSVESGRRNGKRCVPVQKLDLSKEAAREGLSFRETEHARLNVFL